MLDRARGHGNNRQISEYSSEELHHIKYTRDRKDLCTKDTTCIIYLPITYKITGRFSSRLVGSIALDLGQEQHFTVGTFAI